MFKVYIPSLGRAGNQLTANLLLREGIIPNIVVESQEVDEYRELNPNANIIVLPDSNMGPVYAREFIRNYSDDAGDEFHWMIDDDIKMVQHWVDGKRVEAKPGEIKPILERIGSFVSSYENVAVASLKNNVWGYQIDNVPFRLNTQVYVFMLMKNNIGFGFRGEHPFLPDIDFCIQVLAKKYCTMLFPNYQFENIPNNTQSGGITDIRKRIEDYDIKAVRKLDHLWPHSITMTIRNGVPNYNCSKIWRKYKNNRLVRKDIPK